MTVDTFGALALSWLLTYALHSTVLLLGAWIAARCLPRAAMGAREVLWKLALVGGLASASVQLACSTEPWCGRWDVAAPRIEAASLDAGSDGRAFDDEQDSDEGRDVDQRDVEHHDDAELDARSAASLEAQAPDGGGAPTTETVDAPADLCVDADTGERATEKHELARAARAQHGAAAPGVTSPAVTTGGDTRLAQRTNRVQSRLANDAERDAADTRTPIASSLPRAEPRAHGPFDPSQQASQQEPIARQHSLFESYTSASNALATPTTPSGDATTFDARELFAATLVDASWFRLRAVDWAALALATWAAGAAFGMLGVARGWWRLRRELRLRRPLDAGPLRDALDRMCEQVGETRRLRLSCSPGLHAPVAFGVWHPEICVPVRALESLSPAQQCGMLAHEFAHLLRRDPLWLCIGLVLERVLFIQPLNRVARRGIEDAAEYLCDDFAARQHGGLALASCLAEIAGWLVPRAERRSLRFAVGMARHPSRLADRIDRLLIEDKREERLLWLAPLALGTCTLLVFVAPGFAPSNAMGADARVVERKHMHESDADVVADESADDGATAPAALAGDPFGAALLALDAEIDTLTEELDALRAELAGRHLEKRFASQLAALQARVTELSGRRTRLRQWLASLSALDSASSPSNAALPAAAIR